MAEKICDFCGEPIAGGLLEHDFATCAHNLKDKVAQLEAENERLRTCKDVFQRFRDFVEKAEGHWLYGEDWTEWVDPALGGES